MSIEKFHNKFIEYALENKLFKRGSKILVGFSGGADSTALMQVLLHFRKQYKLNIMAAHINYHLRGEDSEQDERFVKEFCFNNNVPVFVKQADLFGVSGMENKARDIRMKYFNDLKALNKLDAIALAHHKDDQAETVLSRFLRGAAFNGLAGIKSISGSIIHPFLLFSRAELEGYLQAKGCTWREDLSNAESDYTRNKIRNSMLPMIEREYNSNFKEKLNEYSIIFCEADKYFQSESNKLYKRSALLESETEIYLDLDKFLPINPILQFYVLKIAWEKLIQSSKDFYYYHFKEVQNLLNLDGGKELSLPANIILQKDYYSIRLYNKLTFSDKNEYDSREISSLRTVFVFNDKRIQMQKVKTISEHDLKKENNCVVMDFDKVQFPLTLRYRQAGDRFIPFGMTGFKKLKDFFIDEKVEKFQRDKVVIFCDAEKIIWVAEHRIDQRVAVDSETKWHLVLTIDNLKENKLTIARKTQKKDK
ncbi:MAG TPA: tRNA lysidine(34) synthetase TilS [Candidatus Cloacimonadota bacterium]|nr:tRNA lysidine(34) synthetase TilS [Candidatus Cloacimonadota bacterium]HQB40809.1 tRNA lysidine(34) synthetase TilS [Candidatus Cloacimonadota bacterium]